MLMMSARRCLRNTRKSARSKELNTRRSGGPAAVPWGVGTVLELVTDLAPGESDEDILERHLAARDGPDAGVVLMLLDQFVRGLDRQQPAVVDDRDAVADRLGLLQRMSRQQDAPPLLPDVLDPAPQLAARLRIEAGGWLIEQQQRGIVDDRDVERETLLLSAGELLERLVRLALESDHA